MIKKYYVKFVNKCATSIHWLKEGSKKEWNQTKESCVIIGKWSHGVDINKKEVVILETEGWDISKIIFLGVLSVLPLSNFLTIILIKWGTKFGIQVLPSGFVNIK